jgi:L-lactate dehydrogenase complex protein LldF
VKIPLHELLIKHRRKIVEDEKKSPFAEKLAMKGYQLAASSPSLYKAGTKSASTIMAPFTQANSIQKGPGPMKPWTDVRDFPAPNKERFRDWYKKREKGEE